MCLVLKASGTPCFFLNYACFKQLELLHWEAKKAACSLFLFIICAGALCKMLDFIF